MTLAPTTITLLHFIGNADGTTLQIATEHDVANLTNERMEGADDIDLID